MRKKAIETTETWNKDLEAGATIEGTYIKKEFVTSNFGENEKYIIKTPDGTLKGIFSTASLARQFTNVPVGSYVWVTYKGTETSKSGRMVKVFEVEYDDEA